MVFAMGDYSLILCFCTALILTSGTYGLSEGETKDIPVYSKSLKSLRTALSYEYYLLPFCRPEGKDLAKAIGLGEALKNDRLVKSPYQFQLPKDETCKLACKLQNLTEGQAKAFKEKIRDGYAVHMSVEGVPVAELGASRMNMRRTYHQGFPLGKVLGDQHVIFNHLKFEVSYYDPPGESVSIKSVIVTHSSIQHSADSAGTPTCEEKTQKIVETGREIYFTYDVHFKRGKNTLRTDALAAANTPLRSVHWSSIYNSFLVFLFLSFLLSALVRRTLHTNVPGYSQLSTQEEARELFEETGWKVLHGDVLRPPSHPALFSAFVGTGVQIITTIVSALALCTFGFLNPALDARLETTLPVLWLLSSPIAGHASARLSLSFLQHRKVPPSLEDLDRWQAPLGLALGFPALTFLALLVANAPRASAGALALPVGTAFGLGGIWILSVFATLAGAALAPCRAIPKDPVRTNALPRPIPAQPWYMWAPLLALAGGAVPFIVSWGEVSLFLKSPFLGEVNPVAFHLFQAPLLALIFAETAILLCFVQLARENYLWWWTSFAGIGSCGLYALGWAVVVIAKDQLNLIGSASVVAFFAHALVLSFALFFSAGTIGFYCSYAFVRHLYSKVPQ